MYVCMHKCMHVYIHTSISIILLSSMLSGTASTLLLINYRLLEVFLTNQLDNGVAIAL